MQFTPYFKNKVLLKRPYLKAEWIEKTLNNPIKVKKQPDGRIRLWSYIEEAQKYLRVVVEPDGETVHNAFFDRGFKK
ncbi:hypothetical protein [Thermodesulfatator atlanticus]|uniref:hypothetical protein n=1 Tax=Thermodesulfatator atlanticus TaxID=501497 RepID=UPI0003B78F19